MKRIMLMCLLLASAVVMSAQNKSVTGHVYSTEDNEPIIGASVVVKGTTNGTVTGIDGDFSLLVPESATTIIVSFVGMVTQEVAIKPGNLNIRLETNSQQVGEIVVTAMGISKEKKALGYAVQDVKAEQLNQGANTSLTGALQGKVSGVEFSPSSGMPGASSKMVIRGARSFTGDNTPLYVVDGLPIASTADRSTGSGTGGADFANRSFDIDPNDIESINILKGQAASALYGMRASNGVVIITTKSGKTATKGKAQITFSSTLTTDRIARVPEVQTNYAQGTAGKYVPNSSNSWGPLISELPNDPEYGGNNFGHPGKYFVPQIADAYGLTRDDEAAWVTPGAYHNASDFFQTGYVWNNSINVQKATDGGNYSFSLGSANQEGVIPNTGMERYNAKLAADFSLNNHFTIGYSGNFVYSRIDKQPTATNSIVSIPYMAPPSYDLKGIPSSKYGDPTTQTNYRPAYSFMNPYWLSDNSEFSEKNQRFFGNAYLDYKTNLGTSNQSLDVKYTLGTDAYQTNYTDMYGYGYSGNKGEIGLRGYTRVSLNSLLTASYNWKINEDLAFDALLGNELVHNSNKSYTQSGTSFNFPGWNHMNNASVYSNSESNTQNRTVGFFANLSLSYRSMLYLNVTGRNDVVSTMPRGHRSFFYPSVSAGFIFTELEPLKNDILTFGKLRGSYAEVGMAGSYYPNYYSKGGFSGGFTSGMTVQYPINGQYGYQKSTTVYDPNLRPQNTRSYEGGIDLTFFKGLFSLNYTYSRQDVKDQIFAAPLPRSSGADSFYTNGGRVHTDTHELTLGINPVNRKNVKWDLAFNFSKIDNYVDELAEGVKSISLGGYTSPNVRAMVGEKYPVVWGTPYRRDKAGNVVMTSEGIPLADADAVIARAAADFILGINTSLYLYKFRLTATLDWRKGGQMMPSTIRYMNSAGVTKQTGIDRDRGYAEQTGVVQTGTDVNGAPVYSGVQTIQIPADKIEAYYTARAAIWEAIISDNDFVKLREISLAYPVFKSSAIEINANVFARNILLWSKVQHIDPESSQGNNNMGGMFELFSLPQTSSYGLGFNIRF
ncbi:SusC/RagA family TonB-linked outer membrane protein [Bacteroidia bacterium]|nr:SusC/RagA family TonB-linked outer membrane protein [Bacteroidia bacterium]